MIKKHKLTTRNGFGWSSDETTHIQCVWGRWELWVRGVLVADAAQKWMVQAIAAAAGVKL